MLIIVFFTIDGNKAMQTNHIILILSIFLLILSYRLVRQQQKMMKMQQISKEGFYMSQMQYIKYSLWDRFLTFVCIMKKPKK